MSGEFHAYPTLTEEGVTMRIYSRGSRAYLVPVLGLMLAATMSACSSSSSSAPAAASSAPSSSAAATPAGASSAPASGGSSAAIAEIKTNWETFFNSSTPNSKRLAVLQNGSQFSAAVSSFASSPLASAVSSKVDSVTLTSATQASVKYDLTAAGTSVASGQTGTAVLQDGVWKVGDDVFCGLLKEGASLLNIAVPAACH
jgi:hypothetical protein